LSLCLTECLASLRVLALKGDAGHPEAVGRLGDPITEVLAVVLEDLQRGGLQREVRGLARVRDEVIEQLAGEGAAACTERSSRNRRPSVPWLRALGTLSRRNNGPRERPFGSV
jgi:hypothetical protein